MNILFLALDINISGRSGDSVHVRELASSLAKIGNNITLVARSDKDSSDELQALKDQSNLSAYIFNPKTRFRLLKDLSTMLLCRKLAKEHKIDVIYERRYSAKVSTILSKILRIPFVVEINGLVEEEAELQGTAKKQNRFTKRIKKQVHKFFFKSANKIVAVAPGIKEELKIRYNIPSANIVVIPNGANTELFRPMDQTTVKEQLGLSQKIKYVCFVGNLVPWQGVEYLIKAAPMVLEKVPEARFLVVGDGMMRSELESMVKKLDLQDKFVFTGSVPFEGVPKYINASDVCVAPFIRARNEKIGLSPLKIYEYLACGKPVVGSNIKGVGDFLEESNAGISFVSEDYIELAHTVTKLLLDSALIDTLGENGRRVVVERYSWGNTAEMVIVVCERLNVKHGRVIR